MARHKRDILHFTGNIHFYKVWEKYNNVFVLLQETIAMARLKRDILQFTGNVHFYKVGANYIVFKAKADSRQFDRSENSGPSPVL